MARVYVASWGAASPAWLVWLIAGLWRDGVGAGTRPEDTLASGHGFLAHAWRDGDVILNTSAAPATL